MRALVFLLGFFFSGVNSFAENVHRSEEVEALEGRHCLAHLYLPEGSENLPLLFYLSGNGIYTVETFGLTPSITYFLNEKKAAVLTFDKPGLKHLDGAEVPSSSPLFKDLVHISKKDPRGKEAYTGVYKDFLKHTQKDLIACAAHAIDWALHQKEVNAKGKIAFRVMSEGAEIGVRLYKQWLEESSPLLNQLATMVLLSPPLEKREKIFGIDKETEETSRYLQLLKAKDDLGFIKEDIVPFASAYIEEFRTQDSLTDKLITIASKNPTLEFHIFHGLKDFKCSAESVETLKNKNEQLEHPLRITFHSYDADHSLAEKGKDAGMDAAEIILKALSE
jgi:hypothetical protein